MIDFLKNILKKVNFNSDNEELNKFNKIIYTVIIICSVFFVGFIVFFVIRELPTFIDTVRTNWNDSKFILNLNNFKK